MLTDFRNCAGCRACEQICNKKAISMQENAEGFLYPNINNSLCNNCGLCEKNCPIFRDDLQNEVLETYAVKNLNKEQILKSASGGIFAALAEYVLEQNGIVFGAAYDENLIVKHIAIKKINELYKLQNSKYVQSDTLNTYSQVKEFLKQGLKVLYSGTPCQIAGLNSFLSKDYENLITVDLICHGVPSPGLFAKYIKWLEIKMGEKIIEYNFRNKEIKGWKAKSNVKIRTKTKIKYINANLDPYRLGFSNNETLRECCYLCKYACKKRTGDFTIGDYWGIQEAHYDFFSRDGVSVILINTLKGKKCFESIQNKIESVRSFFEIANKYQVNLERPAKKPISRYSFVMDNYSFSNISFLAKIKFSIELLKKYIKKFIPNIIWLKIKTIKDK